MLSGTDDDVLIAAINSSSLQVPCLSPSGRYIVRLFAAGRWRKVEVDDSVPVDATKSPVRTQE